MGKYISICIIFFSGFTAYAQPLQITLARSCPVITIHGVIGNDFNVTMVLSKVNTYSLAGYYQYDHIGTPINLMGDFDMGRESMELVELDESFNKRATFQISFRDGKIKGVWIDAINKDTLPFSSYEPAGIMQPYCSYSFQLTGNTYDSRLQCYIDMPGLNCLLERDAYGLVYEKEQDSSIYVIIEFTHLTVGCTCRGGPCGCGVESGLIWVEIRKDNFTITQVQRLLLESCASSVYCKNKEETIKQLKDKESQVVSFGCNKVGYSFDESDPKEGFLLVGK